MPLAESRRKQLDDIVAQMERNNEPSDNIQFVVDDFKAKYGEEPKKAPPRPYTGRESLEQAGPAVGPEDRIPVPDSGPVGYLKGLYHGVVDPIKRLPSDIAESGRKMESELSAMSDLAKKEQAAGRGIEAQKARAAGVSSVFGTGAKMVGQGLGAGVMSVLGGANAALGGLPMTVLKGAASSAPVQDIASAIGGLAAPAAEAVKDIEEDMSPEGINRRATLNLGLGALDAVGLGVGGRSVKPTIKTIDELAAKSRRTPPATEAVSEVPVQEKSIFDSPTPPVTEPKRYTQEEFAKGAEFRDIPKAEPAPLTESPRETISVADIKDPVIRRLKAVATGVGLEDRDVVMLTVPKAENTLDMSEYLNAGRKTKSGEVFADTGDTPATIGQLAGTQATKAMHDFDRIVSDAGKRVRKAVDDNKDEIINTEGFNEAFDETAEDLLNLKLSYAEDGEPIFSPARGNIPPKDEYIRDFMDMHKVLSSVEQLPTVENAYIAKRMLNDMTYKSTPAGYQKIDKLDVMARRLSSMIDERINNAIPDGSFRAANKDYSDMIDVKKDFYRRLGPELNLRLADGETYENMPIARHAESFMNRLVNSGADSNIKAISSALSRYLPGWNLLQDAHYARMAKIVSGDTRGLDFQTLASMRSSGTITDKVFNAATAALRASTDPISDLENLYRSAQAGKLTKGGKRSTGSTSLMQGASPSSNALLRQAQIGGLVGGAGGAYEGWERSEGQPLPERIGATIGTGIAGIPIGAGTGLAMTKAGRAELARLQGVGPDSRFLVEHGTPHRWQPEEGLPLGRNRLDKMGTGEGAQAFGYGSYWADEGSGVADQYAEKLAKLEFVEKKTGEKIVNPMESGLAKVGYDEAIIKIAELGDGAKKYFEDAVKPSTEITGKDGQQVEYGWRMALKELADKDIAINNEKYKYTADIVPPGTERLSDAEQQARLLDWDKPFSEQGEFVKKAFPSYFLAVKIYDNISKKIDELRELGKTADADILAHSPELISAEMAKNIFYSDNLLTGREFYEELTNILGSDKAASEYLLSKGIVGHRFFDGQSRGKGVGTKNTVMYTDDPSIVRVLGRNDEVLEGAKSDLDIIAKMPKREGKK